MRDRPDFDIPAKGDHVSFIAATNILDLALAAGECGQALREDFGCETQATMMANEFVRKVRDAPRMWSGVNETRYVVANSSAKEWKMRHEAIVEEAAGVFSLLALHSELATGVSHHEPLSRLRSKVEAGRRETRYRAARLDTALTAALKGPRPASSSNRAIENLSLAHS
jgi:hypothetical protein